MKKLCLFFVSVFFISQSLFSQIESFGTWSSVDIEKSFKKLDVGLETELRTIYTLQLIERWSLGLSADYDISKKIKVGLGYQFMNKLDKKYLNYQFRNRLNVSTTGKLELNDFTLSLKEKIQVTLKDESKRLKDDGSIDTYSVNSEWSWRNRFEVSYNIPKCKITPSLSVESFYQLNNSDGNSFDNIRTKLAFDYKINKRNSVELFAVLNSALDSEDASGKYIAGISYSISLK